MTVFTTAATFPSVQQALVYIEKNPIAETLFKDVTGYNIPRLLLTRSKNEFFDTLTSELANTSITLVGTLTLPPVFQRLMAQVSGLPLDALRKGIKTVEEEGVGKAVKLARLGSSLGYMNLWGSLYWGAPFLRNWLTLKRTHSTSFEHLIGLAKPKPDAEADTKALKSQQNWQLRRMAEVIGVGISLAALSIVGFGMAARQAVKQPESSGKLLNWLFHHFDLKGEQANQVAPLWATLIFWSSPAYLGWLQASRSHNEFKENLIKALNSNLWFFFLQPSISRAFLQAFQSIDPTIKEGVPTFEALLARPDNSITRRLLQLKNQEFAIGLGITISMLAATPQILNRYLTRRRFERDQRLNRVSLAFHTPPAAERKQKLISKLNTVPFEGFFQPQNHNAA